MPNEVCSQVYDFSAGRLDAWHRDALATSQGASTRVGEERAIPT